MRGKSAAYPAPSRRRADQPQENPAALSRRRAGRPATARPQAGRRCAGTGAGVDLAEPSRKLSGKEEALLVATACSKPPLGRARGTLELAVDALIRLTEHEGLSRETVCRRLAENDLKPWRQRATPVGVGLAISRPPERFGKPRQQFKRSKSRETRSCSAFRLRVVRHFTVPAPYRYGMPLAGHHHTEPRRLRLRRLTSIIPPVYDRKRPTRRRSTPVTTAYGQARQRCDDALPGPSAAPQAAARYQAGWKSGTTAIPTNALEVGHGSARR